MIIIIGRFVNASQKSNYYRVSATRFEHVISWLPARRSEQKICARRGPSQHKNAAHYIGALKFAEFPDHISIDYVQTLAFTICHEEQHKAVTNNLPFLNAKNSNTLCTSDTTMVKPKRYGLVSAIVFWRK